jgi:hypothetical protein
MACKERCDLGFDRLRQQPARAVSQHLRQRILRSIGWSAEADHVIFVHAVSGSFSEGVTSHHQDTPPFTSRPVHNFRS